MVEGSHKKRVDVFLSCDFVNITLCSNVRKFKGEWPRAELDISPHGSQFKYQPFFKISGHPVYFQRWICVIPSPGMESLLPLRLHIWSGLSGFHPRGLLHILFKFWCCNHPVQKVLYCARPKHPIETR